MRRRIHISHDRTRIGEVRANVFTGQVTARPDWLHRASLAQNRSIWPQSGYRMMEL
jgi:hypothetical protein